MSVGPCTAGLYKGNVCIDGNTPEHAAQHFGFLSPYRVSIPAAVRLIRKKNLRRGIGFYFSRSSCFTWRPSHLRSRNLELPLSLRARMVR
jgi:hypothetical protein